MASPKIYLITDGDNKRRMVRATTKQMAIGFVARREYTAKLATQEEIVKFMTEEQPAVIEDATKDKEDGE